MITTFSVNDTIGEFITKMNQVSTSVGDPMKSSFAPGKNIVDQINILRARVSGFDDSSEIITAIRQGMSAVKSSGSGDIQYSDSTGVVHYTPSVATDYFPSLTGVGQVFFINGQMFLDSNISGTNITDGTIALSKCASQITLDIYDSVGATLYTFTTAGI